MYFYDFISLENFSLSHTGKQLFTAFSLIYSVARISYRTLFRFTKFINTSTFFQLAFSVFSLRSRIWLLFQWRYRSYVDKVWSAWIERSSLHFVLCWCTLCVHLRILRFIQNVINHKHKDNFFYSVVWFCISITRRRNVIITCSLNFFC